MPHSNDSIVLDNDMLIRVFNLKCFLKCVWWSVVGAVGGSMVGGGQRGSTSTRQGQASDRPSLINSLIRY